VAPVEVLERFQTPKRDQLPAEEELAVVAGTFVAAAVAAAAIVRKDYWVGSTQPMLPYLLVHVADLVYRKGRVACLVH